MVTEEKLDYSKMAKAAMVSQESDGDKPSRKLIEDPISAMVGTSFYIENKYEDWKKDHLGNRLKFTRYYPLHKLYIDLFPNEVKQLEINTRRKLVKEHGGKYIPVKVGEALTQERINKAIGGLK